MCATPQIKPTVDDVTIWISGISQMALCIFEKDNFCKTTSNENFLNFLGSRRYRSSVDFFQLLIFNVEKATKTSMTIDLQILPKLYYYLVSSVCISWCHVLYLLLIHARTKPCLFFVCDVHTTMNRKINRVAMISGRWVWVRARRCNAVEATKSTSLFYADYWTTCHKTFTSRR